MQQRWERFLLLAVLAASAALWGPLWNIYVMGSDDVMLMGASVNLAEGRWDRLLAPQEFHIIPLHRVLRLYFDLYFPERYGWMHAPVVVAHLASAGLLYLLSRRVFVTSAAALATTALFAWHGLAVEALVVKSQNTFVLSLPLLLAALYALIGRRYGVAALCLTAAVGFHSLLAAAAIPGVLLGYYLLGPATNSRRAGVWIACGLPVAAAVALWLWAFRSGFSHGLVSVAETGQRPAARLWDAAYGVALHYAFLVRQDAVGWPMALGTLATLTAVVTLTRGRPAGRWVLTALALTALPVFCALLLRTSSGYWIGRYAYQSFLAIAAAAGAAVDLLLAGRARRVVSILLLCAAPAWWWIGKRFLDARLASFPPGVALHRDYWMGWKSFLDGVATPAAPFRLAFVGLHGVRTTLEIHALCHQRGRPGVQPLTQAENRAADCLTLWEKLHQAKGRGELDAVPLPSALAIIGFHDPDPPGDLLVCRAADAAPGAVLR